MNKINCLQRNKCLSEYQYQSQCRRKMAAKGSRTSYILHNRNRFILSVTYEVVDKKLEQSHKTKELSVNKQHYLPSISKHLTYEVFVLISCPLLRKLNVY
jgi:flagellar biosynthesis chaperone FliJ